MGPFSVFTVFVGVISCFRAVDKTSSSFSAHGKIGNFIIIIIIIKFDKFGYLNPILRKLGVTHDLSWKAHGRLSIRLN